jgi:4-amino-4-deoxy-L-arabinose transferase-like glycosyltransferase
LSNKHLTQIIEKKPSELICLLVSLLGLAILCITTALGRHPLTYDEPYYLNQVELVHKFGPSVAFLRALPGPAGPLYAIVHLLFEWITHLEIPGVRLVNTLFLLLMVAALFYIFKLQKSQSPLTSSLSIIGAPMIPVVAGMALTEIPAMFFISLSLLLLLIAIKVDDSKKKRSSVLALLGGVALGISILGRQPFLVVLFTLPLLLLGSEFRKRLKLLALFCISSLILIAPVFYVWGGLLPPVTASIGNGFSLRHGLFSFSYAACLFLIFAPKWFSVGKGATIVVVILAGLLYFVFGFATFIPGASVAGATLPDWGVTIYSRLIPIIGTALGAVFLLSTFKNMWLRRDEEVFLFLSLTGMCIVGTAMKVTHIFSSRYTAMAIPFILLMADPYSKNNSWKAARLGLGIVLGLLSLASYLQYVPSTTR